MGGSTKRVTYARARLWTGVSGVGLAVVLATTLLVLGTPTQLLADRGGTPASDAALLFTALACMALALLPFDVLGGLVLPRRFGRPAPSTARFALGWLRGVLVLLTLSTVCGTLLLVAGRAGGRPAALALLMLTGAILVFVQEPLARLVSGLRRVRETDLRIADARPAGVVFLRGADPGFSGGFAGLSATPVMPERWMHRLQPRALALLVERRRNTLRSGAWRRAWTLAVLWNASGFLLASLLPGAGVQTPAELLTTALGFTLWTFLGLLILPTPSRRATVSADASVAYDAPSRKQLEEAVSVLDRLQDDEPERSARLESIFHPVPSVTHRLAALSRAHPGEPGAWHLARTALYLSHAGLSLLPRAVHCNVGRPELWVYLPTDG